METRYEFNVSPNFHCCYFTHMFEVRYILSVSEFF